MLIVGRDICICRSSIRAVALLPTYTRVDDVVDDLDRAGEYRVSALTPVLIKHYITNGTVHRVLDHAPI